MIFKVFRFCFYVLKHFFWIFYDFIFTFFLECSDLFFIYSFIFWRFFFDLLDCFLKCFFLNKHDFLVKDSNF